MMVLTPKLISSSSLRSQDSILDEKEREDMTNVVTNIIHKLPRRKENMYIYNTNISVFPQLVENKKLKVENEILKNKLDEVINKNNKMQGDIDGIKSMLLKLNQ